ncbi:hypothetical protein TRVL_10365 [Trypanosoma vivax]|nr:hypothetical protein TRVL_10365 [Trypanosoma vivax]
MHGAGHQCLLSLVNFVAVTFLHNIMMKECDPFVDHFIAAPMSGPTGDTVEVTSRCRTLWRWHLHCMHALGFYYPIRCATVLMTLLRTGAASYVCGTCYPPCTARMRLKGF